MPKPEACRYLKSHEWAHLHDGTVEVGISDHAQKEITDVVFVEVPKVGRKLSAGEAAGVVESVKAAFDIYSPVAGEVTAVNEALVQDPGLVNRSPHEEGWLFRVKAARPEELQGLMDWKAYQEFLAGAAAHGSH